MGKSKIAPLIGMSLRCAQSLALVGSGRGTGMRGTAIQLFAWLIAVLFNHADAHYWPPNNLCKSYMDPHLWSFGASSTVSFMDIGIYDLLSAPNYNVSIQSFQAPYGRKCFNDTSVSHDDEDEGWGSSTKCDMSVNIGFALKLGANTITIGGNDEFVVDGAAFVADSTEPLYSRNYSSPGGSYQYSWSGSGSQGNYSYVYSAFNYSYSTTRLSKDYSASGGPVVSSQTSSYFRSAYNWSTFGSYQYSGMSQPASYNNSYSYPAFDWSWTYYVITYNGLKIRIDGGWPSSCCLSQPNKVRSIYIKDTTTLRNVIAASTSGLCLGGGSNASNVTARVAGTALQASGSGSGSDSTNVFDTAVLSAMLTTNGWQSDGSVNTSWTGSPVHKYYSDLGVSLRRDGALDPTTPRTPRRSTSTHTVCSDNGFSYETALSQCAVAGRVYGMFESCVTDYCASGGSTEMLTAYSQEALEAAVEADSLGDQLMPPLADDTADSTADSNGSLEDWAWIVIIFTCIVVAIVAGLAAGFFFAKEKYQSVPMASSDNMNPQPPTLAPPSSSDYPLPTTKMNNQDEQL